MGDSTEDCHTLSLGRPTLRVRLGKSITHGGNDEHFQLNRLSKDSLGSYKTDIRVQFERMIFIEGTQVRSGTTEHLCEYEMLPLEGSTAQ